MNKIKIYELYKLTWFFLFHNIGTFSQGLPVYHINIALMLIWLQRSFSAWLPKLRLPKIYKDKTMCPSDRHNYIQCPPVMSSFVYPNNKDVSNNKRLWQKTLAGYDNMTYIFLKSEAIFVTCITYVAFML